MVVDFYISLVTAKEHLRLEVASSVAVRDGVLSPSPPSIFPRKYNSMWILATVRALPGSSGTELPRTDHHWLIASYNRATLTHITLDLEVGTLAMFIVDSAVPSNAVLLI